jgi:glycosyltransferase involved in cell wall biosynthesis
MTTAATAPTEAPQPAPTPAPVPALDIVVPVHNEEAGLESCLRRLHAHLTAGFPYRFRITVADNASTDGTLAVARRVAAELPAVTVVHLAEKGRGRALRAVWSDSDAPVLAYMDVDLSTDLAALAPLVAPLLSGHSDLAIGTRLARGSRVVRGAKREVISRGYNLILRGTLATRVLRRAVRVQGDPRRRRRGPAAAGRGRRLVLRHRAARAGRAIGVADPRGTGGLGRRP